MDQISVESSESGNSSRSTISYEGTEGYISDGEDPFFELIDIDQEKEVAFQQFMENASASSQEDIQIEGDQKYEEKIRQREKKAQHKQIIRELKYGRNTALLLNKNPLVPSFEEVQSTLQRIKERFPERSIECIISRLHGQLIEKPKQAQRIEKIRERDENYVRPSTIPLPNQGLQWQQWLLKRRVAAESFVQLGYGVTLMRKFIESYQITMEITYRTYEDIIQKLLKEAYLRLQRFLRKKCHKKVLSIVNPLEQKFLLQILKNCRSKFDSFQIHNFFKLIKPTYCKDDAFRLSKRIASRIYHTCKEYISRRKIKQRFMNLDNPDCELYNNDKDKWTDHMIQTAVNLFIKEANVNRVKEIMMQTSGIQQWLLDIRNIKYHIGTKVREGIKIIMQQTNKKDKKGNSLKEMVALDGQKINQLVNDSEATNVRVLLCEICEAKELSNLLLNQTILAVNDFVLKKENDRMLNEIKKTDKQFVLGDQMFSKRRRRAKKR